MRAPDIGLVLGAVGLALAAVGSVALAERKSVPAGTPARGKANDSVTAGACQSCHPSQYASWHQSFHRTMTRLATPATVAGPFDGTRVESEGRTIELSVRGNELFARLPDPDEVARLTRAGAPEPSRGVPLVSRRIVLATGSHHMEVYWVVGGAENELRLVPITYLVAERRFIPRRDAFLQPPSEPPHAVRWNSNCIQCHATLGRPGHDERAGRFSSEAAELGIACEACHGEGGPHVRKHQNPLTRYAARFTKTPDDSIVNPARLVHDRASEVCGQCHAYFLPNDMTAWWQNGFSATYRPGDHLERSRTLLSPGDFRNGTNAAGVLGAEADVESAYWGDGTMRVGGREHNALALSACYTKGAPQDRISCLSCHSMHESDPDDQLRADDDENSACRRCHADLAKRATEHSHHTASSSGNSCVACHMPYTSYALFKGIRSHRIDNPSAIVSMKSGRPNACNLCHLDKNLAWADQHLTRWYFGDTSHLRGAVGEPTDEALAIELLLAGDAAQRAIAAWAFGLPESRVASGTSWQAPYLAALLDDPYSAVRFIAGRSLRTFPGFSGFEYDFLAAPERRRAARDSVLSRFSADRPRIEALLSRRDGRPVSISE